MSTSTATLPATPAAAPRRAHWPFAALLALGLLGLPLYVVLARLGDLPARPVTFALLFVGLATLHALACGVVRWHSTTLPRRGTLASIAVLALLYRSIVLPASPSLSDDFYRYVWDGAIQRAGFSPYRWPPNDPVLLPYRDATYWPRINRKEQTSAYPPFAELLFRALATARPFSATAFKLTFLALDLLTVRLLVALLRDRGASPLGAIVYAWHPLPVVEFLHSAHIDVLAVALLTAALLLRQRGKDGAAGVALGLATLSKLYPALLLPAFVRRDGRRWRLPLAWAAVVLAGFAPALLRGDTNFRQLPTYLREEQYTSGERFLLLNLLRLAVPLPTALFVGGVGLLLLGVALRLTLRPIAGHRDVPRRALGLAALVMLLVTPAYPWYFAWLLPLLAVTPVAGLLFLTYTLPLNYVGWAWALTTLAPFTALQYVPAALLLAVAGRRAIHARRKG